SRTNGVSSTFGYDVDDRLTSIRHSTGTTGHFWQEYLYDAVGNRIATRDVLNSQFSDVAVHDRRNRLRSFQRGTLNSAGTAIGTPLSSNTIAEAQTWDLDRRGNWSQDTTSLGALTATNTHSANSTNEYTYFNSIALQHDHNG